MRSAEELHRLFEEEFRSQRFNREPHNLYEPFEYMIGLGGKRMRPVMLLMACEMFAGDARIALRQAMAVELFHNFTLIHDDIMDNAPLRRGRPTVHSQFNQTLAILSGDVMLVYSYQYLIPKDPLLAEKLLQIFNDCAIKVCEGQQMDMNFETSADVRVEDYLKMIELKTATLVATSLEMGALAGGASLSDAHHLYEFGKELGIAFQLKDDWLDTFGDATKVGKQPGGDIIQNKKTFLYLEALRIAEPSLKDQLVKWYSSKDNNVAGKMEAVLDIFDRIQINQVTSNHIDRQYKSALLHLQAVSADENRKKPLRDLAAKLMQREH